MLAPRSQVLGQRVYRRTDRILCVVHARIGAGRLARLHPRIDALPVHAPTRLAASRTTPACSWHLSSHAVAPYIVRLLLRAAISPSSTSGEPSPEIPRNDVQCWR